MRDDVRAKTVEYTEKAAGLLSLVPDIPGLADNIAIGILRLLLSAIAAAFKAGRSPAEVIAAVEGLDPAARLSVDQHVSDWLISQQGDDDAGVS